MSVLLSAAPGQEERAHFWMSQVIEPEFSLETQVSDSCCYY